MVWGIGLCFSEMYPQVPHCPSECKSITKLQATIFPLLVRLFRFPVEVFHTGCHLQRGRSAGRHAIRIPFFFGQPRIKKLPTNVKNTCTARATMCFSQMLVLLSGGHVGSNVRYYMQPCGKDPIPLIYFQMQVSLHGLIVGCCLAAFSMSVCAFVGSRENERFLLPPALGWVQSENWP